MQSPLPAQWRLDVADADSGMPSKSRPAGTSSACASVTIVGNRGARSARSILEIAVVCSPVWYDRSSWDHSRSLRKAFRFAAKRSRGLTSAEHARTNPRSQETYRQVRL